VVAREADAAPVLPAGFVDRRAHIFDVPATVFRGFRPTYDAVNATYLAARTRQHLAGSLPDVVEWLVKSWEAEVSHKPHASDIKSVAPGWTITTNGGQPTSLEAFLARGSYNALMGPEDGYDPAAHTFESSHDAFRSAFSGGFAWEVTEVWSGPPKVAFAWHHFGVMAGAYGEHPVTGRMVHLYGAAVANTVGAGADLKIGSIEVFYDPTSLLHQLQDKPGAFNLSTSVDEGGGCPLGFGRSTAGDYWKGRAVNGRGGGAGVRARL